MIRFRSLLFLSAVFLLLPSMHAQERRAMDSGGDEISGRDARPTVRTFTVTPVRRPAAILAPNARVPDPPESIDPARLQEILGQIGGEGRAAPPGEDAEAESRSVLDHIVLTAREPYYEGQGYLTLTLPRAFHPESAIVFSEDHPNSVGVKLNLQKDGLYLVDFAVRATQAGVYKVATESGEHEFEDSDGALEHVLVALKAGASGWTMVRMSRSGAGYNLYSVEITRVGAISIAKNRK